MPWLCWRIVSSLSSALTILDSGETACSYSCQSDRISFLCFSPRECVRCNRAAFSCSLLSGCNSRSTAGISPWIENPRVLGSIPSPGTTILKNPLKRRVFAFLHPDSSSNEFDHSQNFTYPLLPQQTLTQPIKARSALPPLPFLSPVSSV